MYALPKVEHEVWRDVTYLRMILSKVDNTLCIYAHAENFVIQKSKLGLDIVSIGRSGKEQTIADFLDFLKEHSGDTRITLNKENFSVSIGIDGDVFVDFVEPSL